jgi:spore germination protein KC
MYTRKYLLPFAALFLLSGCWNVVEIEDVAFVTAIGVDYDQEAEQYLLTLQVINPATVAETESGIAAADRLPVTNFVSKGSSLLEAVRSASNRIPREPFLGHVQHVILSEDIARDHLVEVLDYIRRYHEIRLTTKVFIAKNSSAQTVVDTVQALELIPARAVRGKTQTNHSLWGSIIEVEFIDIISAYQSKGREIFINGVILEGNKEKGKGKENYEQTQMATTIVVDQIALFKAEKLEQWIPSDITRGLSQILNEIDSTIVVIPIIDSKEQVSIELIHSNTSITTEIKEQRPVINVHVYQVGNIGEASVKIDAESIDEISQLEDDWSNKTTEDLQSMITLAQQAGSDVLGFGDIVHIQHPSAWKTYEENWADHFQQCEVNVQVESVIRRSGMRF